MNNPLFIFIVTNATIILLFITAQYLRVITDDVSNEIRQVHSKRMIRFGGFAYCALIPSLFIIENKIILFLLLFSYTFFLIGIIADVNKYFGPFSRLIISIILVLTFLGISDLAITNVDIKFIDDIINNSLIASLLFTSLAILFFLNGSNLIDGQHGLLLGSSIIIFFNLLYSSKSGSELNTLLINLILISSILFLYNFFSGKIKLGDNGAYFLGFIISSIAIYMYQKNLLDPFHTATIMIYPTFEAIFTYLRRVISQTSPFKPDASHLHSNIFNIFNKHNLFKFNRETANRMTSISIISLQIIFWLTIENLIVDIGYKIAFFSFVAVYLLIYTITYFIVKRLR